VGIIETAKNGIIIFDTILQLQKKVEANIQDIVSRAANAKKVVDFLYKRPIINAEKTHEIAGISLPSAYKLIIDLEKMDVLKVVMVDGFV
jgi:hypothetical protein